MKVYLEFSLPEENEDYESAVNGGKLQGMVDDFYEQSIRRRIKYDDTLTKKEIALLETLREEWVRTFFPIE